MIDPRYVPVLFAAILSGVMSLLVAGISTLRAIGVTTSFVAIWIDAWLTAWAIAFPVVLVVAPITRKMVQFLVRKP